MSGLALGGLGNLVSQRRSGRALGRATAEASAQMPSETGLATATSSGSLGTAAQGGRKRRKTKEGAPPSIMDQINLSNKQFQQQQQIQAIKPATGPVQQNQGVDSPTPAPGESMGLRERLMRRRKQGQQAGMATAALR